MPTTGLIPAKKKGKIQIAKAREGVIVPAMRENPTPATGPVVIKHVRNTVPKAREDSSTSSQAAAIAALKAQRNVFDIMAGQLEPATL